jgi:hypothetical protein
MIVSPARDLRDQSAAVLESSRAQSLLYGRNYTLISLTGYSGGVYDRSFLAYGQDDNDSLRSDAIAYMRESTEPDVVVKYSGTTGLTLISRDGSEYPLSVHPYDGSEGVRAFIHGSDCFTLRRERRYRMVETREEIKRGMVMEYFNNNKWNEVRVSDPDTEYDRMYRLLIKYNKLRVCID